MDIDPAKEVERLLSLGYRRQDITVLATGEVVVVDTDEFAGSAVMLRKKRIAELKSQLAACDRAIACGTTIEMEEQAILQGRKQKLSEEIEALLQKGYMSES